ncbi:Rhodanese-related sulfurtransferase [Lishizhenia tianjinensis]|uniref:Rhodanese-related sulfurtransferase n=1 Tax=Lishizhenia tianjinensis TaxID=477690 RepID=A0A1I6YPS6_9FLAO|nr:rhodanese-like domain-containing protein [Lishizhenia tianjinensis]SFT52435.1 Rhodanese-related sulfurtransferase [Lishizhenia tianjinensis]
MKNLSVNEWREAAAQDEHAVILDVRSPGECMEGIVEGAIQMNLMDTAAFIQGIDSLDKSKNYYVYCRSGNRSGQACMLMETKGLNAINMAGGMMAWPYETVMP